MRQHFFGLVAIFSWTRFFFFCYCRYMPFIFFYGTLFNKFKNICICTRIFFIIAKKIKSKRRMVCKVERQKVDRHNERDFSCKMYQDETTEVQFQQQCYLYFVSDCFFKNVTIKQINEVTKVKLLTESVSGGVL